MLDVRSAAGEWGGGGEGEREGLDRIEMLKSLCMQQEYVTSISFFGTASKRVSPALPSVRFE